MVRHRLSPYYRVEFGSLLPDLRHLLYGAKSREGRLQIPMAKAPLEQPPASWLLQWPASNPQDWSLGEPEQAIRCKHFKADVNIYPITFCLALIADL